MPSITGQSILVIGGSSGIGAAVAKLALAEGLRVAIASSNSTRVADAVKKLESSDSKGSVKGYTIDLRCPDLEPGLEQLLSDVTGGTQLLDHIIITAGTMTNKAIAEVDAEYIVEQASKVITPLFLIAKLAPRFMKQSSTSSLIFTGGRVDEKPVPDYVTGSFFAAGLHGLVRGLALEKAPTLRANLVSPGMTDTELWDHDGNRAGRREYVASTALFKRAGQPEEVAEAYIYLMKDSNATGICIRSSGGALLQ